MSQLKREMGLRDVTLFAIACIVGTRWIPAAAHAGPGSITLWLLAALLFVIPLAIAVASLIVKYPGVGGLYLWTRGDYGPWHGFLCFWVYWMGLAIWFPSATMFYMSVGLSTLGIPTGRITVLAVSLLGIWVALGTNLIGMKVGKWTQNLGGAASWIIGALLAVVAALVWSRRGSATPMHLMPHWNWDTLSLWSTIAYAMSGLELAGLMGGEMRDPERTMPRAGWIASGFAVLFYASATVALLVVLQPEKISELNGYAEVAHTAGSILGSTWLAPAIGVLVLASGVGQIGGIGTAISRLPFAAGVDGLLPKAFARVHPRWGTPHYSIIALGFVASFLLIAVQFGDTMRAAYQALVSLMVIVGFLPYLYIFGSSWKAGNRISALAGWSITILAILCSVVPTAEITNVWLFEAKLAAGTLAAVATAWLVYVHSNRSRARKEALPHTRS
ncbi:MAG TPA: APC family permease [Candidatus Sulfopaludibacter sp.]|jgi:amino acid transporter|nr:APC family permease [Candidatus Sulfopaludibacter sp.]